MRRPYTLYKETNKSGTFWYTRFWDETLKKYAHSRSTRIPIEWMIAIYTGLSTLRKHGEK